MPTIERSFCQGLLEPRFDALRDIYLEAWDRWLRNPERGQYRYRRTRANVIHEYVMADALIRFGEDPGIHIIQKHESALFFVDDSLLFRMKKGNERGLASNVDTQTAMAFNDPDEELNLFNLPDVPRVDVTYVLNPLETLIANILVVARDGDHVIWTYSIFNAAGTTSEMPTTLPVTPQEPPTADTGMRLPGADQDQKDEKEKKAE